jgi:hypothetical protein
MAEIDERSATWDRRAVLGTWLAVCLAATLAAPQPPRAGPMALAAAVGALLVLAGFAATRRVRPLPARGAAERLRLGALSLGSGAGIGLLLLGLLVWMARQEPKLRARFAERAEEALWRPLALAFESSILEEVAFRLFALAGVVWIAARLGVGRRAAVGTGVAVSTLLFGLVHLPAWSAATEPSALVVGAVVALNGAAALLLAFLFWRWGLPYAILGHFAGDVVVQTAGPRLLG